jgi:antitoxin FitA
MSQPFLEQLNPVLVNQIEALAQLHGRSLQAEIEHILQQAVQSQLRSHSSNGSMAEARAAIDRAQTRYAGHTFNDSAELIREDRDR